jgi:hypothetical protein
MSAPLKTRADLIPEHVYYKFLQLIIFDGIDIVLLSNMFQKCLLLLSIDVNKFRKEKGKQKTIITQEVLTSHKGAKC